MKIYLQEITDLETELDFTENEPWVIQSVERVDEAQDDDAVRDFQQFRSENLAHALPALSPPRPVSVHFSLRKVDEVIVISGHIDTSVKLVCSRCAVPFNLECHPGFSGLFCKDPVMAGVGHLTESNRPAGQNQGFARHAHDASSDRAISEGKDLDITYLSDDYIDLSEVLTEHLQLQVPFQPLCQTDCKGMCTQCGADLNTGRCACAKIAQSQPFSVLRDLKL
ncbi:DUF177 domain-containing protein [Bdellovibrionota bacterium FG-1]